MISYNQSQSKPSSKATPQINRKDLEETIVLISQLIERLDTLNLDITKVLEGYNTEKNKSKAIAEAIDTEDTIDQILSNINLQ